MVILALLLRGRSPAILAQIYALYVGSSFAMTSFCLFFTSFFKSNQINPIVTLFSQFQSFLFYVGLYTDNYIVQLLLSLSPKTPMMYGVGMLAFDTQLETGYTLETCYLTILFDMIFYYTLFIVLNASTSSKVALWNAFIGFFKNKFKREKRIHRSQTYRQKDSVRIKKLNLPLIELEEVNQDGGETSTHNQYGESPTHKKKVVLRVKHLENKSEGSEKIENLSLKLVENEVFTLVINDPIVRLSILKLFTGIILPQRGDILIYDMQYSHEPNQVRSTFGVVSHMNLGLAYMKVEEILTVASYIRGMQPPEAQARIQELLEEFQLTASKNSPLSSLSSFLYRKVMFAMALVHDPEFLILDQPTVNLDLPNQLLIWNIISKYRQKGKTIIILSNSAAEAEEVSTRIGVMDGTTLVCKGPLNHLRKIYSVGYDLSMTASEETPMEWRDEALGILKEVLKKYDIVQNTDTELNVFLTTEEQHKFSELFKKLESIEGIHFTLYSYSLSHVITKLSMKMNVHGKLTRGNSDACKFERRELRRNSTVIRAHTFKKSPKFNFGLQLRAMFFRRFCITKRFHERIFWNCFPLVFLAIRVALFPVTENAEKLKVFIMFSHITGSGTNAYTIITERNSKTKMLMYMMGLRRLSYWMGNLIFDLTLAVTVNMIYVVVVYFLNLTYVCNYPVYLFFLLSCFDCYVIILCYCWSYGYANPESAQRLLGLTLMVMFVPLPFLILNSSLLANHPSLLSVVHDFTYLISPIQAMYDGVEFIMRLDELPADQDFLPFRNRWMYPLSMLVCAAGYFFWLICLRDPKENKLFDNNKAKVTPKPAERLVLPNQTHIAEEYERVVNPSNTDEIQVQELKKVLPSGKVALNSVTFGVKRQEIFGIVGPSRSGKTTILETIAGLNTRTSGDLRLFGVDIYEESYDIFKFIGLSTLGCTLWNHLTVEEHMKVMGMIKGISPSELKKDMAYLIKTLDLTSNLGKPLSTQSPSVKRKVSLALALIGSPSIILLDEPVLSFDSQTKMKIFEILRRYATDRGAAIIFATQNIQEALKLCDRVAVMLNGEPVWLTSVDHLVEIYDNCYSIFLQKMSADQESLLNDLQQLLPNIIRKVSPVSSWEAYLIENLQVPLSKIFELLGSWKRDGKISDFSITASGIEQSYTYISQFQS